MLEVRLGLFSRLLGMVLLTAAPVVCIAADNASPSSLRPVRPGEPGVRPFWNQYALRFIDPPAFDCKKVESAKSYRFDISCADGKTSSFTAERPAASLTPVWEHVPEGVTTLSVQALDASGKPLGEPQTREFYRSPGFSAELGDVSCDFDTAASDGLAAIVHAPHVRQWLTDNTYDRGYVKYCYPNKVMGALARACVAYAKVAGDASERHAAQQIAARVADYLLSVRFPADAVYANIPPTYSVEIDAPTKLVKDRVAERWLMTPSAIDAAFGFLDVYDLTKEAKYLAAAKSIADTFVHTQESDGTWPLMVDWKTGKPIRPQRLVPTWVIFFFDRLANQYGMSDYQAARDRAWQWIEKNPLRTYQWDGQFEDVKIREPYVNLAREQACDVAVLLFTQKQPPREQIEQAEELLRFAEDQFVVWQPVKDPEGWMKVMPNRRQGVAGWITPCVLEQYTCYGPVARSSAVLINAYLTAYRVTHNEEYLLRARALGSGLLKGQQWLAEKHEGGGEIPTWLRSGKPVNWLNNSYYAAEAVRNLADATKGDAAKE